METPASTVFRITTEVTATWQLWDFKEMKEEELVPVERILGYKFNSRSIACEALTHASYYPPGYHKYPDLDRLEFLGDSVLNLLVTREIRNTYPSLNSGLFTRLRAANVDTEKLARAAVDHDLHLHLRHNVDTLDDEIDDFIDDAKEYPLHSNGLIDPPKLLADFVESVIGGVFVDSNGSLEVVWKVIMRLVSPLISIETLGKNPTTELYEFCQKRKLEPKFLKDTWVKDGMVKVLIDGNLVGIGVYGPKKEIAMNRAAKDAINKLKHKESIKIDLNRAPEEPGEFDQNPAATYELDKKEESPELGSQPP